MTSYMSLLVCVISGARVPQKCGLQKLVKKSRFVEMAKFFRRSYFNKVQFQIGKYKILGDWHFKGVHIATFELIFSQATLMLNIVVYQTLIVTNVPVYSAALQQFMQCVTLLLILVDTGLRELYLPLLVTEYTVQSDGCENTSVSISGAEINLTLCAVTTYVLCCNLAPGMSALKMCIFSNIVVK